MVYIFGDINFPVLEVLLTVTVLLIMGWVILVMAIYYILKELRAFRVLAMHEKQDIREFGQYVNGLEHRL